MRKQFNFNNEQNLTPIDVNEETGVVEIEIDGQTIDYESVSAFAHAYATARNVKADNLKNWTLVEDGDTFSFILRAGTAGLDDVDYANMARALRAADMSPEDIGRAMASAAQVPQQASVQNVEPEQSFEERQSEMVDGVLETFEDTDNEQYLFLAYGVSNQEALKEAILADNDSFVDLRFARETENMDEWEIEEAGYDESPSEYPEDNLYNNLSDHIYNAKTHLTEKYQGIAAPIALSIERGGLTDEQVIAARTNYIKARGAARFAQRNVPVAVVSRTEDGEIIVTHTFDNQIGTDIETGDFYEYDHRFVLSRVPRTVQETAVEDDAETEDEASEVEDEGVEANDVEQNGVAPDDTEFEQVLDVLESQPEQSQPEHAEQERAQHDWNQPTQF